MPGKKIYFASDFHLGARYIENPIEYERRIVRWLDSIKQDAGTLYLLGDILDYWYEYRYVVPKGFTRFFGKLAELSDNDTGLSGTTTSGFSIISLMNWALRYTTEP